ncbi:MAG: hypothetical protein LQ343_004429 [Gyalolechia ehrenbergii]|nr:MAG: hypothetical protein LQ343_004429 [Gyalolechia ehrenbergii]
MANQKPTFSAEACRIETSVRARIETGRIEHVQIFKRDQIPLGYEKLSSLSVNVVHGAWAKLLRSYVYSDTISFGTLRTSQDDGAGGILGRNRFSIEFDDARICQYHDISERKWGEWLPDVYQDISRHGFDETQINTAVHLWAAQRDLRAERGEKNTVLNVGSIDWPSNMTLQYRSSKICDSYAQSIARTIETILVEIVLNSGGNLGRIDSVSKEDKETIRSWNARELYASRSALHDLIRAAALSKPDSEAVCAWDGSMTYAELEATSSNFARQLIRDGVGLGDMIPFAFEKSRWTVVAILAIMKAGGAFVPLLPTFPKSRIEDIMSSVKAKMVVTSQQYRSLFAKMGTKVVEVSAQTAYTRLGDKTNDIRLPTVGPQDTVFVLFTSGSTGKPKGVVHEHGPIATHAICAGEAMGYHNARVFAFASHIFDISILDMTTTLVFGGCVCVPSEEDRVNSISEVMNRMKVDLALLTPSVANLLRPDDVTTLKTLICAGECYKEEIIRRLKGKVRLLNSYGPAETQFTHLRYVDRDDDTCRTLTVGALLDTAICVLVDPSNHDHLVPIGGVGEILVAATTLARGYLNDEDKTRSAFIVNPAWAAHLGFQDRIFYKTGDLLRYNVGSFDGRYDFVGRKDTQIKIHGQRVEVGEVEHHLARIPGLALSIVVFPSQGCFSGQLVAVVQVGKSNSPRVSAESISIDTDQPLSIDTLRKHLSKTLPYYTLPSECLTITRMPLTTSCKVDRKSVEAWIGSLESTPLGIGQGHKEAESDRSPLNEDEATAHAISAAVAEMVASRDPQGHQLQGQDFVLQSSGINSIQIMSLSMFVRKSYNVKIPMEHFYSSSSTVRSLACLIDRRNEFDNAMYGLDLSKEIELHTADLLGNVSPKPIDSEARHVFMTGASGYLGSGILQNLLSKPDIDVYALMRCSSSTEGFETVSRKAKSQGWWQPSYASKLHIWPGDLTQPRLGLSNEHLRYLQHGVSQQTHINTVIHNGARVHYNTDYNGLKPTNLHPTMELLSLLHSSPTLKTFVYVSGGRRPTFLDEEEDSTRALVASQTNGYSQSKFVAESLVRNCMNHPAFSDKNLHIVQPGYIIGSPVNGVANLTDFIWRLVAACLEIGAYNADEQDHWLFIADVDAVAEAVVAPLFPTKSGTGSRLIDSRSNSINRIRSGLPFSTLWHTLQHDFGYTLRPLPQGEWLSRIEAMVLAAGPEHVLFPLLATLEKSAGSVGTEEAVPMQYVANSERVREAVVRNVKWLAEVGFLPKVDAGEAGAGDVGGDVGAGAEGSAEGTASSGSSLSQETSEAGTSPIEPDEKYALKETAT